MRLTLVAAWAVLTFLPLAPRAAAQGQGALGSNGLEPRLTVAGRGVLAPTTVAALDLGGTAVLLLLSPQPGAIPLDGIGLTGAILGLDPAAAGPLLFALPVLPVSPAGTAALTFTAPASLLGQTYYLQAAVADPGAPAAGLALSDAAALTFGGVAVSAIASAGPSLAAQTLVRASADASAVGPVLPALGPVEIVDVVLNAVFDSVPLRSDQPVMDRSAPSRPRILLPDGGALYRYRTPAGAHGIFLVRNGGQDFHHLLEVPGVLRARVAVSPFEPLAAVVADLPVAAFGGAQVFLLRTDGRSFPGMVTPVRPLPPAGALAGFDPDELSPTFLAGALLLSDGGAVVRVPTSPGASAELVAFPPSGIAVPVDFDEDFAWSADGTLAALTAGSTNTVRDVYLVGPAGPAVNLTQDPGEYDNVGYEDVQGGALLALAPDASRAAFVRKVNGEEDLFFMDTPPASPISNVTPPAAFGNSLEAEAGILFASRTKLVFINGFATDQADLYAATLPAAASGPISVANVTGTSGVLAPPYNVPGTLRLVGRASLPGGGSLYRFDQGPGTAETVVVDGAAAPSPLVMAGLDAWRAAVPSAAGALVAVDAPAGGQVLRVLGDGTVSTVLSAGAGTSVAGLAGDAATGHAVAVLAAGGGESLALLPAGGPTMTVAGSSAPSIARTITLTPDGGALAIATDALGGSTLLRIAPAGTAQASASVPVPVILY